MSDSFVMVARALRHDGAAGGNMEGGSQDGTWDHDLLSLLIEDSSYVLRRSGGLVYSSMYYLLVEC